MADGTTNTPVSPAPIAQAGLGLDEVRKIVADAVAAAVAPLQSALKATEDNQKVLADSFAATPPMTEATLTAKLQEIHAAAAAKATADSQAAAAKNARTAFIAEKLVGVPDEFLGGLGEDPAKFGEQEQAIRTRYQAVLTAGGVKAPDLGGDQGGKPITPATTPAVNRFPHLAAGVAKAAEAIQAAAAK